MSTHFQIRALPIEPFAPLFSLGDEELARIGAKWSVADAKPGYPCRVSLLDAEPGERLILVHYTHQDADTPYRSSGAIFIREGAEQANLSPNEVPPSVRNRLLSFRAYSEEGILIDADVAEGRDLETVVSRLFSDPQVSYLHLHNARPGCYSCRVDRVDPLG